MISIGNLGIWPSRLERETNKATPITCFFLKKNKATPGTKEGLGSGLF